MYRPSLMYFHYKLINSIKSRTSIASNGSYCARIARMYLEEGAEPQSVIPPQLHFPVSPNATTDATYDNVEEQ